MLNLALYSSYFLLVSSEAYWASLIFPANSVPCFLSVYLVVSSAFRKFQFKSLSFRFTHFLIYSCLHPLMISFIHCSFPDTVVNSKHTGWAREAEFTLDPPPLVPLCSPCQCVVFICWESNNKVPQTRQLKQQKFNVSWIGMLDIPKARYQQGSFHPKAIRKNLFPPLS